MMLGQRELPAAPRATVPRLGGDAVTNDCAAAWSDDRVLGSTWARLRPARRGRQGGRGESRGCKCEAIQGASRPRVGLTKAAMQHNERLVAQMERTWLLWLPGRAYLQGSNGTQRTHRRRCGARAREELGWDVEEEDGQEEDEYRDDENPTCLSRPRQRICLASSHGFDGRRNAPVR